MVLICAISVSVSDLYNYVWIGMGGMPGMGGGGGGPGGMDMEAVRPELALVTNSF